MKLNRREFLKALAAVGAGAGAALAGVGEKEETEIVEEVMQLKGLPDPANEEPFDLGAVMKKFPDSEGTIVIRDGMPTWVRMNGRCPTA